MHVTFVTSAFLHPEQADLPGVRRYSTELVRALVRRGLAVRVVVPAGDDKTEDSMANVEIVRLRSLKDSIGRTANLAQASVLSFASMFTRTTWLTNETDIVHTTVPLLSIDTIQRRRPVVAFNHHVERIRSTRDLLSVPFANCYGSYTYRRASAVVAPSAATAAGITRRFSVNPAKVVVIHHGIDTGTFFRDESLIKKSREAQTRTVLFVGPMTARKNVMLLVHAFKQLKKTVPNAELVLVGSGPLESQIDRLLGTSTLRGGVVRLNRISDDRLRTLYSMADVFVSPSLDEGFGFAAVEAMACGTPVVALDTAINREIIGEAGILVPHAAPGALCGAVEQLLENPRLASILVERGLRMVEERYSWNIASEKYAQLYQELLRKWKVCGG